MKGIVEKTEMTLAKQSNYLKKDMIKNQRMIMKEKSSSLYLKNKALIP